MDPNLKRMIESWMTEDRLKKGIDPSTEYVDPDYVPLGDFSSDFNDSTSSVENIDPSDMVIGDNEYVSGNITKKGTIRKRKKYEMPLEKRQENKFKELVKKHKVKEPCKENVCKKGCIRKIPHHQREYINIEFWKMKARKERKAFISHHISSFPVKQRTAGPLNIEEHRRNKSLHYYLKNEDGTMQNVCKVFFLTTLGFASKNGTIIPNALKRYSNSEVTRTAVAPHNKIDDTHVIQHILTFNPTISHYRREHAPNRLYLPSDLTFHSMHQDFIAKNPKFKCSYEKYRIVAKEMNISIVSLGHEECENCETFNLHDDTHTKDEDSTDEACVICCEWKTHIHKANMSRNKYREDAEENEKPGEIIYCADLQKVVMLPRLDMFSSARYANRLTVYNESFVPVGKKQKESKAFAALWHEALFERNKEELISTFHQFFIAKKDVMKFTLWLDNCTAQNKNWAFFSFLIYIVNSDEIAASTIEIKYFEPGHTFMAADSFHHRVELAMKHMGNKLYDFQDFVKAVKEASRNGDVLPMQLQHFSAWMDYSSQYKLGKIVPRPYINDMVHVKVERGSLNFQYKTEFDGDFIEINFLNSKVSKSRRLLQPSKRDRVLGITSEKKETIVKVLGGIMKNRLTFWENLPLTE